MYVSLSDPRSLRDPGHPPDPRPLPPDMTWSRLWHYHMMVSGEQVMRGAQPLRWRSVLVCLAVSCRRMESCSCCCRCSGRSPPSPNCDWWDRYHMMRWVRCPEWAAFTRTKRPCHAANEQNFFPQQRKKEGCRIHQLDQIVQVPRSLKLFRMGSTWLVLGSFSHFMPKPKNLPETSICVHCRIQWKMENRRSCRILTSCTKSYKPNSETWRISRCGNVAL